MTARIAWEQGLAQPGQDLTKAREVGTSSAMSERPSPSHHVPASDLRGGSDSLKAQALALNGAVATMTSPLDDAALARLLLEAAAAPVALHGGRLAGFLIGFDETATYFSPNYLWFRARLERFAYVDRVVVAPWAQRRGVARDLYARFAACMGLVPMVCEVNSAPPNPGSEAFHARLGFVQTGSGSPAPDKVVRYLIRQP